MDLTEAAASGLGSGDGLADIVEGGFDELFALVAVVVIDGGHGLDGVGGRATKVEGAVDHFALVEDERAVAEHDKAAVAEFAGVVFVKIEDDFFACEFMIADFHINE